MNNESQNTTSGSKLTHEQISARAQSIWNAEGRPEGRDEAIWLQAEKQLYDEARETIPQSSESPIAPPAGGPQSSGAKQNSASSQTVSASAQSEQMTGRNPATNPKSGSGKRKSSGR